MSKSLHERINGALQERTEWEERQRIWYAMRRDGIRRRNREGWQADLHLPIADNAIEKLKPYYLNGIFQRQQLASFTPLQRELAGANAQAAEMLDWKLKKETNYAEELAYLFDLALLCGRAVLKVRWDPQDNRLCFEAIDPLFFIVPPRGSGKIDRMDWFCHVKHLSVTDYRLDPRYEQDEELIERIRGGDRQHELAKQEEKESREGITYSKDEDEIVLWEAYERVKEGWRVCTFNPTAPEDKVRKDFLLQTRWRGKVFQPFVSFVTEVTDKGWYAPRGLPEKVMSFESFGTKCWNAQADWLAYSSKPIFTQDAGAAAVVNPGNVKMKPGEVFPPGIKPDRFTDAPMDLEKQINLNRQLAEESAGSPDFGAQSAEQTGGSSDKTATEWNYIGSFASQNIQHKAWITGLSEGEVYWRAWALLLQFGGKELTWIAAGELKVLPAQALSDQYLIEPDLKPDSWDKTKRLQRAIARKQMFTGDPNIDQVELDRSVLEEDDPRLVKRLLVGQSTAAGEEMEDEAKEILILEKGFPATVSAGEDHALRIRVLAGYMELKTMRWRQGIEQPDPVAIQRIQEHLAQHVQYLQQQNPKAAKQFIQAIGVVSAPQTETISGGGSPGLGSMNPAAGVDSGGGALPFNRGGAGARNGMGVVV